jgi:RNA polymerase sigma factor (sigma-70 family)
LVADDFLKNVDDDDSDQLLLARAAAAATDATGARRAQARFYERHVRYLYGVLKRREGVLRRVAGIAVEDLVQDTFQRAFHYGATYQADGITDAERLRLRTRAWLGRIAQNLVAAALKGQVEVSASPFIEQASAADIEEEPPSTREVRAMRKALEDLSEREQDVLRVTALYQRVGDDHQRLPNEVSTELALRWGTNSQNIRAIRSRAIKKLKTQLEETLKHPEEPSA